ncbi:hypothetical protein [Mycobacterium kubicae]|nr:hypothetical protein [Mycobacterium kubicae]ORV97240.1 hypothetical protein AWC13_16680 [Mycobacterium kubicae]
MRQPSVDATQHAPNTDPTVMRPNTDPNLFAASSEARGQAPWPAPPAPRQDAPAPRQDAPPAKPKRRRLAVMLLSGAAVLTVIGVVAAVLLTGGGGGDASHQPSTTEPNAAPDNSGPFTGEYTADFGPKLSLAGQEVPNSEPPDKETWVFRSSCGSNGCVATASRQSGRYNHTPNLILDDVRGRWIAVILEGGKCNDKSIEKWNYVWLQPRADGSMDGEWITDSLACYSKRKVTFTRTGDANVASLGNPADQPTRVVSPAQGLHGFYHQVTTYSGPGAPKPQEGDYNVDTICLRTGDRCLSRFVRNGTSGTQLLQFANNEWTRDDEYDAACPAGGTSHVKINGTFPLPEPPHDPIAVLTGSGFKDETGSSCKGGNYEMKFTRSGG